MGRRIIRLLFPERCYVRCQDCWVLNDCAAYLETGVIDYLPDECPNRPMLLPTRHHRTRLQGGGGLPRFWAMCTRLVVLLSASPRH
jgi:hypothetical protein